MNRALARRGVTLRACRSIVAPALAAAILLAGIGPAAAWQTSPGFTAYAPDPAPGYGPVEATYGSFSVLRALDVADASAEEPQLIGQTIASTALAYIGYPYVAGGAGPGGFDCSGFTQFIVGITTGIWVSHAVEAQPWSAGVWVDYGEWQPGDLIFFQNTYRPGISHVGIYIGDGLMVHAENWESGVTIDNIYSSYYGPRYWGAVRVG